MTRTKRNLLLVTGLLLAAAGTWAAFRFRLPLIQAADGRPARS